MSYTKTITVKLEHSLTKNLNCLHDEIKHLKKMHESYMEDREWNHDEDGMKSSVILHCLIAMDVALINESL